MPATIQQRHGYPQVTVGDNPSAEDRYVVVGAADRDEALAAMLAGTVTYFDLYGDGMLTIPRTGITIEELSDDYWEGIATYGPARTSDEVVVAFDTTGGQQHVTQSRFTRNKYGGLFGAPDFGGAIGVTSDGVQGVDLVVPVYQWSETHYYYDSQFGQQQRRTIFDLTGTVNAQNFREFLAGENLFLGARGARRGYGKWEVEYRFAASPNLSNLVIGTISGVDKLGWDYLWVYYELGEDTAAKSIIRRPRAVYVESVYPALNHNLLPL